MSTIYNSIITQGKYPMQHKEENKLNNEVIQAINRHLETMTEEEQIMTLKYIHALKDFREVTA